MLLSFIDIVLLSEVQRLLLLFKKILVCEDIHILYLL